LWYRETGLGWLEACGGSLVGSNFASTIWGRENGEKGLERESGRQKVLGLKLKAKRPVSKDGHNSSSRGEEGQTDEAKVPGPFLEAKSHSWAAKTAPLLSHHGLCCHREVWSK
jgi:hypothetical protein